MLVWLTLIVSFLAATIASAFAAGTSIVRCDSLGREWWRRAVFGTSAFIVVWATYFVIGRVIGPAFIG